MSELDAIYALHDQAIADRDELLAINAELLDAIERLLHLFEIRVWVGPNTLKQAHAAIAKAKAVQP